MFKKKYWNNKSTNQNENFLKKTMFRTLKWKGAKNSYGSYPAEFAGSTQNPRKKFGARKLTNQNKNLSKKTYV
jgi:hypothetical protein